jgi:hypothetical protein
MVGVNSAELRADEIYNRRVGHADARSTNVKNEVYTVQPIPVPEAVHNTLFRNLVCMQKDGQIIKFPRVFYNFI